MRTHSHYSEREREHLFVLISGDFLIETMPMIYHTEIECKQVQSRALIENQITHNQKIEIYLFITKLQKKTNCQFCSLFTFDACAITELKK